MLTLSKRAAIRVSLAAITVHWIYQIATMDRSRTLPSEFMALVVAIVRTKCLTFAAIWLLLELGSEGFAEVGLTRREWPRAVAVGLAFGVAMFLGLNVVLSSALDSLFPRPAGHGPLIGEFFRDPRHLLVWLPIGIFGGGVVEEIERIFVLTRFEKWLGRPGLILAVVLSSAMFGVGHLYQGIGTGISTSVSGLVFALLYVRRRSALEPITAHALSDVLAMLGATMIQA